MCSLSSPFSLLLWASLISACFNPRNNGSNQWCDPRQGYNPYQRFPSVPAYENRPVYEGFLPAYGSAVGGAYRYYPPSSLLFWSPYSPQSAEEEVGNRFTPSPLAHISHGPGNHTNVYQVFPILNHQRNDFEANSFLQKPEKGQQLVMIQPTQLVTAPMPDVETERIVWDLVDEDEPMPVKKADDVALPIPNDEEKFLEPIALDDYFSVAAPPDINVCIEPQDLMFSSSSEKNVFLEPFLATALSGLGLIQEPFLAIVVDAPVETETAQPQDAQSLNSRRLPRGEGKNNEQPQGNRLESKEKKKKRQPKKIDTVEDSKKRRRDTGKAKAPAPKKRRSKLESELEDLAYTYERREVHLNALGRTRGCKDKAVARIRRDAS